MRTDRVGMFWEDVLRDGSRSALARPMPKIPETGWVTPREFPNLSAARVLSIDTETYDPHLLDNGPGWARGDGHLVGISVATEDGYSWYFPMRHTVETAENLEPANVLAWAKDTLENPRQDKIGANLIYDVGWLQQEGVYVRGDLYDVQFAEALLDESARTNLDALAMRYLGLRKQSNELYTWCSEFYGGADGGNQRANIYRAPPKLVGPYAQADATLPLGILLNQFPELRKQGLYDLFRMECGLIPLLLAMRFRGVRVDLARAEKLNETLAERVKTTLLELRRQAGFEVNVNASDSLAKLFRSLGVDFPTTAKGNSSFTQSFLNDCDHPIADLIREARRCEKLRGTFVESYILNNHVKSRVYGQFHPLRGESGGTRSGRMSSSTPNLQNIPSRDEEMAPLVRGLFLPDENCVWSKSDYSQIEYRFLVHFAVGPGADEARLRYCEDSSTDYHQLVIDKIKQFTGFELKRKPAKNINFGLIFGMGIPKLTRSLGLDRRGGLQLFDAYHKGVPYVAETMDATAKEAEMQGYITTILGRRSRFDLWEPKYTPRGEERSPGLPFGIAIAKYGHVKRAYLHKALNRRLQGSAADLLKAAMLAAWDAGIFHVLGAPHVTVHDELGQSRSPDHPESAWKELWHIMQTAIPMRVPVLVGVEQGPDWGHVE